MENQKESVLRVKIPVVERSRNDCPMLPVVENGLVLSEVEVAETTLSGAVDREVEFALLLAVTNGYIDYYSNNDLFDLTYAG